MVRMLAQVVYQTNADYFDSCDAIARNPLVVSEKTAKGIMTFRFMESQTVFLLSPEGKLQVKWNDVSEKRALYKLVKRLLIAKEGEKLEIKPLKQQTWIDYPVPASFELYWCDKRDVYELKTPKNASTSAEKGTSTGVLKVRVDHNDVLKALEELRRDFAFFREPTFNEVALKSGCTKRSIINTGLLLGSWKFYTMERAERIAVESINLAGWLKAKEKQVLDPRLIALANKAIEAASLEVVKKAQEILRNNPELAGEVVECGIRWRDETNAKWVQVFGCPPPLPCSLGERVQESGTCNKGLN